MFISQLRVTGLNSVVKCQAFLPFQHIWERHTLMGSQQTSFGTLTSNSTKRNGSFECLLGRQNAIVASFPAHNDTLECEWGWGKAVPHCEPAVMCICLPICIPSHMWYFAYIIINNTISKENHSEHLQYPECQQLLWFMTDRDPPYGYLWHTLYSSQDYVLRLLDI